MRIVLLKIKATEGKQASFDAFSHVPSMFANLSVKTLDLFQNKESTVTDYVHRNGIYENDAVLVLRLKVRKRPKTLKKRYKNIQKITKKPVKVLRKM